MADWISVKELRPEPNKRVLVSANGFVDVAFMNKAGYWNRFFSSVATHWMPLPEPPKEGQDGN